MPIKTKPKSHVGHPLRPRTRLSPRALGFLVAIFGIVGIITIFASSASSRPLATIQGEKLQPQFWVAFPFTDRQASDGKGMIFFGNVTATSRSFEIKEAATEVTVRAKAQKCLGDPQYQVQVDGKAVGMHTVRSTNYSNYVTKIQVPAGRHTVGVRYLNDGWSWRCDRNLMVDHVTLSTDQPEPVVVPPGSPDGQSGSGQGQSSDTNGVQAKAAASLIDSMGVNTHINYGVYPYNDWAKVKQGLQKLGIKHVRDGNPSGNTIWENKLKELHEIGIKGNLLTGDYLKLDQQITALKSLPQGFVASVESINEPDCFLSKERGDWVQITRDHQKALYERLNNDPTFGEIDILGTSYCREATAATVGDLSAYSEFGNIHPYPAAAAPEQAITDSLKSSAPFSGGKPFYATETGYHNALYTPWGHIPSSQKASGIYTPRLYMSYFMAGVKRTFIYELVNQRPVNNWNMTYDPEGNYGLLNYDFSEKASGAAVRRLTALLGGDTVGSFTPGKLAYKLEGDTSGVQQLLMQKANGKFYLAIWRTDSVWDRTARRDLPIVNKPLTVKLEQGSANIKVYNINTSDTPTASSSSDNVALQLGPEVQIIEIQK